VIWYLDSAHQNSWKTLSFSNPYACLHTWETNFHYQQAVRSLYKQRNQLPPEAQTALYCQPLETVLELPTPQLQNWTERGYTYFYQQLKAAKHQATLHTPDIRNYFWSTTQLPHDLQPPWETLLHRTSVGLLCMH